jgi:DNA-binding MarR family transcriptional regulator
VREQADEIALLLYVVNSGNRRAVDEALRPFGTNLAQLTVLRLIAEKPGSSNSDLAERGARTAPSMGTLVAPLVARRLVVRKRSGHRMEHFLSEAGDRLLHECLPIATAVLSDRLAPLDVDEREVLLRLLYRIAPGDPTTKPEPFVLP